MRFAAHRLTISQRDASTRTHVASSSSTVLNFIRTARMEPAHNPVSRQKMLLVQGDSLV
jgi:hypothetical protein